MANGGLIKYSIGFNVDKAGLNQIKSSLQEIKQMTAGDLMRINSTSIQTAEKDLKELQSSIAAIDNALDRAFNTDLGTLNITKFNQQLKNLDLDRIYAGFSKAGAAGQAAFRNTTAQILTTNMQLKQTHKLIDNMATTMANTIKWGVASSVMNKFTGSVQQAYGYVKSLDGSLNDIRIVTEKSSDEMAKFAVEANKAAKALGKTTTDYTDAALIYYQQGLSEEEVKARAETTLKAANVTGQAGAEVSEQLTAVWNGYKVSAEEAELYVDKLAAVAATTAADLEELSTGMSKVASAASTMGVDVDQLNAQLATIVSVTRQAPESVGTALKTIYARMGDIEAGLDTETTLGNYTEIMAQMGFNVLDANGKLRDMGEVVEEIGSKWESLSREQQVALSQTVAGTRQYNNLLALFDNWDMYTEAMETSKNSAGTLQEQQDIYMESTAAHLNQLKSASEDLYDSLLNPKGINSIVDGLTTATDFMANFIDAIGGGGGALLGLGSIATKVFSKQIANGLVTTIKNFQTAKENAQQLQAQMELTQQLGKLPGLPEASKQLVDMKQSILALGEAVTNEEHETANALIRQTNELYKQQELLQERKNSINDVYERATGLSLDPTTATASQKQLAIQDLHDYKSELETIKNATNEINKQFTLQKEIDALQRQKQKLVEMDTEESKKTLEIVQAQLDARQKESVKISNIEEQIFKINELIKQQKVSPEIANQLTNAINEYYRAMEGVQEGSQKAEVETSSLARKIKAYLTTAIVEADGAIDNLGADFQQEGQIIEEQVNHLKQVFNEFKEAIQFRDAMQKTVQFISSIGQVASALNSLSRLDDIWNNEDLSTSEKTLQIIQNLGFAVPMLINGVSTLGSNWKAMTKVMGKASIGLQTFAKAHGVAGASVKSLGGAIGSLFLTILPYVVILGAVGIALHQAVKAHNADADAAKAAAEEVTKLTNRYNELRESVNNFKDSVSDYSDAIDSLKDLDAQTKEYGETVDEINEKAKALIETYGLYDKFETKDGILQVKEGVDLDELIKERETATDILQQSMYAANIASSEANLKSQTTNLTRAFNNKTMYQNGESRQVGVVTNDLLQQAASMLTLNDEGLSVASLAEKFEDEGLSAIAARLDESLKDQLFDLAEAMDQASSAADYWSEQILAVDIEEQFGDRFTKTFDKTKSSQMVSIIAANAAEDGALSNALTNIDSGQIQNKINDLRLVSDYSNEELIKKYAQEVLGIDELQLSKATIKNKWLQGKGNLSIDGQNVLDEDMSFQDMREAIARQQIQQDIIAQHSGDQEEFANTLTEITTFATEAGKTYGVDFSTSLLNALSASGLENFSLANLYSELSPEEVEKLKTVNPITLLGLDDETLKALGEEGIGKFLQAWKDGLDNYDITPFLEKSKKDIEQVSSAIETLYKGDELDEETIKELEDRYTDLAKIREKGGKEYLYILEQIQQAEEETLTTNSGIAYNNAVQDFSEALTKDLDTIQDTLHKVFDQEYILDWSITDDIISDAQDVINQANGIQVALSTIGDGFKVSAEDSKELFRVFPELAESAQVLANGTIQLNGQVVSTVLNGYEDMLTGDKEATIDRINLRIAELDNEIEMWEQSLQNYKDGETDKGEVTALLANFQQETNAEVVDQDAKNQETVLQNDGDTTEAIISNWAAKEAAAIAYGQTVQDLSEGIVPDQGRIDASYFVNIKREVPLEDAEKADPIGSNELAEDIEAQISNIIESKKKQRAQLVQFLAELNYETTEGMTKAIAEKAADSTKDLVDALEDELDIYHDINIELTKLETSLGKLEKQEEKLFGQDLVNNLNKQLDILDNQKDAYREKIALAQMEAAILRASLSSQGVAFGADGTITNYNAMLQAKMDAMNALNEQYNQMSEDEQKAFKNTLEAAEKEYEKFKEDMERYEEVVHNEIPEMQESIQDIIDREVEINIQKLNMEVELRLDLTEAQKDWDEFQRKVIDDLDDEDIYKNALADKDLYKTLLSNGVIGAGTDVINTTLAELAKMNAGETSEIYGNDKNAALENLQEQMSNLMGHLEELADLEEEIHQAYLDMVDKIGESFDEQIEGYEYVNDLIEHNLNLVQLLKGDDAYADMALFYEQQAANNLEILRSQKEAADYYKMMMETETDPEAIEKWTELWKDAVSGLNSAVEDAIENIIDKYTNTINVIFDELNDKLTNGLGLDYLTQQWELQNDNADAYLDTVNSAYELQQLENKYLQSIDDSDSVYAQRELNKLMEEELEKLREKDKLTQYDIDRANAMYELKLKEIALEEAQQNKSQMRLRRDASGNYSYQFVADSDSIAEAQREVDEARNSLYNMDKDEYRDNQQAILDLYTEYQEKMREAANLSAEERALIEQEYNERINNLIAENGVIRANLSQSAMMELADAEEAILMNEIIPQWDGGLQQMIDKIAGEGGLGPACTDAMNALDEATRNYNEDLAEIEETAGVTFEALADGQDINIDLAETLADRQAENIELTIEEMDAVRGLVDAVEELRSAYDDVYSSATKALGAAQELREFEYQQAAEAKDKERQASSNNQSTAKVTTTVDGQSKTVTTPVTTAPSSNVNPNGEPEKEKIEVNISIGNGGRTNSGIIDRPALPKDIKVVQFKTGGYTSAWGSEGRFAMLHEKELVLNQTDTANILTAVNAVRSIAPILEAIDSSVSARVTGFRPNFGGIISGTGSSIDQHVTIEANFPNVSNRYEIEAAFSNLVNRASQHAFNTQR